MECFKWNHIKPYQEITPPVTALIPHPSCPVRIQESVYRYVLDVRKRQHDPTILLDAKYDNMYVDGVISENSCLAWFDAAGQLHSYDKKYGSAEYNMFQNELRIFLNWHFRKIQKRKGTEHREMRTGIIDVGGGPSGNLWCRSIGLLHGSGYSV